MKFKNYGMFAAEGLYSIFCLKYVFIPSILFAIVLASSRRTFPRWTHYLIFIAYVYFCVQTKALKEFRSEHPWMDHLLGSTLALCLLSALHVLVLVDPIKEYQYTKSNARSREKFGPPVGLSWSGRVYWAWSAIMSLRGVGWNYQTPHVPTPHKHTTRAEFSFYTLAKLCLYFLLVDLAQTTLEIGPFLPVHYQTLPIDFSIRSLPYHQRILCTFTWFLAAYAGINAQYYTVALFCVATGLSESEDWPAPFGSLTDAYSVRNFWAKVWHAFIRRLCVSPGRRLIRLLGMSSKSLPGALMQLYTAFFVSALTHSIGDYAVAPEYYGASISFFMLQPVAITMEEVVKFASPGGIAGRNQSKSLLPGFRRVIGYIWVVWWLTETAPLLLDPAMQVGFDKERMFPWSVVSYVVALWYRSE
jgi:hypothetical protein